MTNTKKRVDQGSALTTSHTYNDLHLQGPIPAFLVSNDCDTVVQNIPGSLSSSTRASDHAFGSLVNHCSISALPGGVHICVFLCCLSSYSSESAPFLPLLSSPFSFLLTLAAMNSDLILAASSSWSHLWYSLL